MPTLRSLVVVVFDMFDAWGQKYCFGMNHKMVFIHWFDALKFNHSHIGSR